MNPILLLVDLQEDFLSSATLEPHRARVTAQAARLLHICRERGWPVGHVRMALRADPDRRMEHWKESGRWSCRVETPGIESPAALAPKPGEWIVEKSVFSPWVENDLDTRLYEAGIDTVLLAGINLEACVRLTALDAYQREFRVWIVEDATAATDPLAGAQTFHYLRSRGIGFVDTDRVESTPPDSWRASPHASRAAVSMAVGRLHASTRRPQAGVEERADFLRTAAARVTREAGTLALEITRTVGKPIHYAQLEVARTAALFHAIATRLLGQSLDTRAAEARVRRVPHGTIGLITPYNNPLAIPAGLWGAAFAYGNRAAWKPAPLGRGVAHSLVRLLSETGLPDGQLEWIDGGAEAALELAAHPDVDAVCFVGSRAAGWRISYVCAAANKPLQAELGGNNAAIVWPDAPDPDRVAREIAEGAFGCAGQRCTATRRLILPESIYESFLERIRTATASLPCGDPLDPAVRVGPLASALHAQRVRGCIERAEAAGFTVAVPHGPLPGMSDLFVAPTIICCDDAAAEIVREETFGPVLVVQRARGWEHALELANGVPQGLAASLFTADPERASDFADRIQAGIVRINAEPAGAGVDSPFAGWKQSGSGFPQHGEANIAFFTRWQSVYESPLP